MNSSVSENVSIWQTVCVSLSVKRLDTWKHLQNIFTRFVLFAENRLYRLVWFGSVRWLMLVVVFGDWGFCFILIYGDLLLLDVVRLLMSFCRAITSPQWSIQWFFYINTHFLFDHLTRKTAIQLITFSHSFLSKIYSFTFAVSFFFSKSRIICCLCSALSHTRQFVHVQV